ncbi:MAG TPA: glycogen debranching N-terminal domain-containing protein, partial [Gaiellaceae bacterium]|nr:glycogen debranching N-terminal domain-containing protein [Gaiellaceae bacterium]
MLTILDGSTFCISDDRGDIAVDTYGFFAHDTRFLSRLVLRVDGARPLLLSSGRVAHFSAAFFLRNAIGHGLPHDSLSISRERFVGTGLQERIAVRNESMQRLEFDLTLELAADFADIISVKLHDFALGDPEHAPPLPPPAPAAPDPGARQILIQDAGGELRTQLSLSEPARFEEGIAAFRLDLDPHERWELTVDVVPLLAGAENGEAADRLADEREAVSDAVAAWTLRVPRVRGGWESLRRA